MASMARCRPTSPITAATIGLREARQLDHLPEHGAEQEHGEVELHEADHLVHEDAGEDRRTPPRGP
jgi:hypothetical protein